MRKLFLLFQWLLLCDVLLAQTAQTGQVSGRILDATTLEPLPFANVFINNTTIGAAADAQGNYLLRNIPTGPQEIVYSYVGYQSYQTGIIVAEGDGLKSNIKLTPDKRQLESIQVTGTRDKKWEKQLEKFKTVFVGTDKVAAGCKILNPWAINFSDADDAEDGALSATASQAIEIENFALGYKVYFYLKAFHANTKSYRILGNYRFEEMQTTDAKLAVRWTQNRREAYWGSSRHLFKSIVEGSADDEGFLLYTDKPGNTNGSIRSSSFSVELNKSVIRFPTDNIVTPGTRPGEYRIALKGRIEAHYTNANATTRVYRDIPYPVSWIEVTRGTLVVTSRGVAVNSYDLVTSGAMSTARVANMLPLDYQLDQTAHVLDESPPPLSINELKWERWFEKVYLHTDKPFYYPGETIWYKGYMSYLQPEMRDSLSRVLHVELVKPANKIVYSRLHRIDSGLVFGDILIGDTLPAGNYYLRAYTEWMRNYEKEPLFTLQVPVLHIMDQAESVELKSQPSKNILISFSKPSFLTRERIEMTIKVTDEGGQALAANLSVSVTDSLQVASVATGHSILRDFLIEREKDSFKGLSLKYFTEYGTVVHGQFFNNKKVAQETELTVVQGNFDDFTTIKTDKEGNFTLNGFQFYDTAQLFFQAKDAKGRPFGAIKLLPPGPPAFSYEGPEVSLVIKHTENPQRILADYLLPKDSKLLNEVLIKGKKLDDGRTPRTIYGKADYTLEGDRLAEISATTNLLAGLQGKIPGLTISPYWDDNGVQHYKVRIRGGSSTFTGSTDPLVLIDGVPFPGDDAGQAVAQLSPTMIARVEVITHASPALGVRGTNGVLALWTKTGSSVKNGATGATDLSTFSEFAVVGYHRPSVFQSPDYESKTVDVSKADYRSTIFWSPYVVVNDSGTATSSFFAADLPGRYQVVVEGVTLEGKPVHGEAFVEIKSRD